MFVVMKKRANLEAKRTLRGKGLDPRLKVGQKSTLGRDVKYLSNGFDSRSEIWRREYVRRYEETCQSGSQTNAPWERFGSEAQSGSKEHTWTRCEVSQQRIRFKV